MIESVIKVLLPFTLTFSLGILSAPLLAHYLYKYKFWKKQSVQLTLDGQPATIAASLHNDESKKTPRMGGILVWGSVIAATLIVWIISQVFPTDLTIKLDFLSRTQTWLPLFTLIVGALVGLVDDYLVVSDRGGYIGKGVPLRIRIASVLALGAIGGWWFYDKLGATELLIPFYGSIDIGILIIPFFIIVQLALFSGSIIDGIDGLSGGVLATMFTAYAAIAFANNQIDLSALCAATAGGILAFLWFNIPPARFYMSETGMLGLTTMLAVIAFLTGHVLVLAIIAAPLFLTTLSAIVQLLSKKFRGKKIFLSAPIHNHFQALGWPPYKVVMRYWIFSVMCASAGLIIALIG